MSLTVIAFASLHALLPWIVGKKTRKMPWVVIATCITCFAAFAVGNGAYVFTDLAGAGIGFFIGRAYVMPCSKRTQVRAPTSAAVPLPQKPTAEHTRQAQTVSSPLGETSGTLGNAAKVFLAQLLVCFAVAIVGILLVTLVTGWEKSGEFVVPTALALLFISWFLTLLRTSLRKARSPRLEQWVRPEKVAANRHRTCKDDQTLRWPPTEPSTTTRDTFTDRTSEP